MGGPGTQPSLQRGPPRCLRLQAGAVPPLGLGVLDAKQTIKQQKETNGSLAQLSERGRGPGWGLRGRWGRWGRRGVCSCPQSTVLGARAPRWGARGRAAAGGKVPAGATGPPASKTSCSPAWGLAGKGPPLSQPGPRAGRTSAFGQRPGQGCPRALPAQSSGLLLAWRPGRLTHRGLGGRAPAASPRPSSLSPPGHVPDRQPPTVRPPPGTEASPTAVSPSGKREQWFLLCPQSHPHRTGSGHTAGPGADLGLRNTPRQRPPVVGGAEGGLGQRLSGVTVGPASVLSPGERHDRVPAAHAGRGTATPKGTMTLSFVSQCPQPRASPGRAQRVSGGTVGGADGSSSPPGRGGQSKGQGSARAGAWGSCPHPPAGSPPGLQRLLGRLSQGLPGEGGQAWQAGSVPSPMPSADAQGTQVLRGGQRCPRPPGGLGLAALGQRGAGTESDTWRHRGTGD